MKATEQYFPVVVFIMPYAFKASLTFESVNVTIQTKATEQYFPVVLFIMPYPYKAFLTIQSVDEILKCDNSNET